MTSGSIGSHRAFMGVSITLCVCLLLTLFVGWKWYFQEFQRRTTLLEMHRRAENKARELESMGLSVESARSPVEPLVKTKVDPVPANVEPAPSLVMPAPAIVPAVSPAPAPLSVEKLEVAPAPSAEVSEPLHPAASTVDVLPLREGGEDVTAALALLDQYWHTEAWKDRIPLVFDSERVAGLMKDFYGEQSGMDPTPGKLLGKARYQINGTEILYFSYSCSRPSGSLEVAMRKGAEGKFLIDWESLTGYGEMSFEDFRVQRPVKPVLLRAYVRLFEYYNFEFNDPRKFLCLKLTSETGESSIYAYCRRGTELAAWLEADLASTGPVGFKGYTIQASFPENAQSNQCVNLDRVLASRWLMLP